MTRGKQTEKIDLSEIEETETEEKCPVCGYPIVLEEGLEVCYRCGWYRGCEQQNGET